MPIDQTPRLENTYSVFICQGADFFLCMLIPHLLSLINSTDIRACYVPKGILGPEDTAGVKTDKAHYSRVFLSTAEAGVGGYGGEQELSDNKQKL